MVATWISAAHWPVSHSNRTARWLESGSSQARMRLDRGFGTLLSNSVRLRSDPRLSEAGLRSTNLNRASGRSQLSGMSASGQQNSSRRALLLAACTQRSASDGEPVRGRHQPSSAQLSGRRLQTPPPRAHLPTTDTSVSRRYVSRPTSQ